MSGFVGGLIVPGLPHPLLAATKSEHYQRLRDAFGEARQWLNELNPDVIVLYSTQWRSVIGHQIQADPNPQWTHVDEEWHALGSMPYHFKMDADFSIAYENAAKQRGLEARTVAYKGFPIDTGSVTALSLLTPKNEVSASVVSCNMYADRSETIVLGKAANDALVRQNKRGVAIAVSALSNRMFTEKVAFSDDRISSLKDDEWNQKILQFLGEGRLEDVSQLARPFYREANADSKFKAIWWLAAALGQHNAYEGHVYAYGPIYGTGAAVVHLLPTGDAAGNLEFDEDDVEVFSGDKEVLDPRSAPADAGVHNTANHLDPLGDAHNIVQASSAPKPVGAYPHARKEGDFIFLSGVGPRDPVTNGVPGGPVWDKQGNRLDYDVGVQTEAVIENVRRVLHESGARLEDVVDVTVFLIDMQRDFQAFNEVYRKYFENIAATRTTLAITSLPTPIAVEFKVVARRPNH